MSGAKPSPRRAVGLRRIAEELGISISLVSKVLSGRLGTSGAQESTIQAIRAKARELNYRKNRLAEALRTGRQNVIAVCVHRHGEAGSEIVEEMVSGIADEAAEFHQRLMILYYHTPEEFNELAPEVHRNAVDGVILGGLPHAELRSELMEWHGRGLPVVTIHDEQLDPVLPNVGINQTEVGRLAAKHLIDQGCRRIAITYWSKRNSQYVNEGAVQRYEGYRLALKAAGLPCSEELMVEVESYAYAAGQKGFEALLNSKAKFDGFFGVSDQHAVAALNRLVTEGRRVPRDVKIIGVDNAPFCQFAIVPLSSVSQEFVPRGRRAVQLLMDRLSGKAVTSVCVDPVVYARQSSVPAKA